MAGQVEERANRKIYGLVYSRATTGRCKPNEIAKDDELIIQSLPEKMMRKVVRGKSNVVRYRERGSLSEHCTDNVKGKESTETIAMKGEPKAEWFKQESQTSEGVSIGNIQIELDAGQKEDSKNINTPMKQKRGADGEIVRAYMLSPQKSLSRLRPRKEVPTFRMVDLEENDNEFVVGKRVKVYWSGSRRWFTGRIVAFDNKNRLHSILYEDGDKEVLELRKERFELDVMPTDSFKLKSEPYSARKADGLDTGNVREAVMKDNSRNVSGANTMTKSSESKQKKEAKKEGKRTSLKALREDSEVIMKDLVPDVDMIPEKVGEVVTNKASDMEEPGESCSEEDESNFFSEAVKEATKEFEAEATVAKSHSEFGDMGSDNSSIKESGKAVEDDSLKISIAELANWGSRKRLMPRAKRMRTNKVISRDFGNVVEKVEANMKSHVHCDEAQATQMGVDINSGAMEVSHLYTRRKKKTAIGSGDVSRKAANEVQKENLIKTEDRTAEEVVIASLLLNPHNVKDEKEVLAAQMEFAASTNKGGKPGDVDSMNTNHRAESILEAESMKPCEVSYYLQPVVQISPEEAKPNVLQGKVKLENGESDKESKEGIDFISEKSDIYASKRKPKQ